MPSFFDFLVIQKIIKKSTPQKINFFGIFRDFWRFCDHFFRILGVFWGPPGVIFRLFWQVKFSVVFFINFLKKSQKLKKRKSSFRIVKYIVSWGSPVQRKTQADVQTYIYFYIENSSKSMQNPARNQEMHKNRWNTVPWSTSFLKNMIFGRFGGPRGNPKVDQNGCQ